MADQGFLVTPDWMNDPAAAAPAAEAPWWPEEWVTPQMGSPAPPAAATPEQPLAAEPPPPDLLDMERPPELGAPAPVDVNQPPPVAAGPAAPASGAPPGAADENPLPFETPESLQAFHEAMGGPAAPSYEPPGPEMTFSPEEAQDADVERLLASGPEELAARGAESAARAENYQATRALEEDTKNRQWAERNQMRWQKAEAQLASERQKMIAEYQALSKQGISNDHWWKTRSTGQRIAAYVAGITGGLTAMRTGGTNAGLDMIRHEIDRDIESQKADISTRMGVLSAKSGILAQMTATNGDQMRSEESLRLAAWENVDQRLAAEAKRLDPQGTAALRIAAARQQVRSEQAKLAQAADERLWNRKKDMFDMSIRRDQLAEQRRARGAAISEQRAGRDAEMLTKGFVRDAAAPGGYRFDPSVIPQKAGSPQEQLAAGRLEKLEQEIEYAKQGRTVQFRGKELGKARSEQAGENMRQRVASYERYQTEITELANMLTNPDGSTKKFYQGPGWELKKDPERDAVMAKALNVLYLQAKINDPSTGVRDAEIQFGKAIVPFVQGLASGRSPLAQANAIRQQADTDLLAHIDQEVIGGVEGLPKGLNPVESWRSTRGAIEKARESAQVDSPEQQAAVLSAPIVSADATEREAFVKSKVAIIDRWAKDAPKRFEGMDVAKQKATWEQDPSLTPAQKKELSDALDVGIRRAWSRVGDMRVGPERPMPGLLPPIPEDPEDED